MLCHTCILGGRGEKQRWLPHPCLLGGPKEGGSTTSPLHSRGPRHQAQGENQRWLPHTCLLGGPKEGGSATAPLHSRGSPTPSAGRKSQVDSSPLHSPGTGRGQKCYVTPAFSGVGAKNRGGYLTPAFLGAQRRAEVLHHPCILGGPRRQAQGENQRWLPHTCLLGGPKEGGSATAPLHSRGSPTPSAGRKSEVARRWAHRLQACIFSKIDNFFFAVRPCNFFWR